MDINRYVIGAVILMVAQTALILGLLVQRGARQRVERRLLASQAKLRLSYERIRQLSRRLLGEQEAERTRIARELHDDINQQLTLLALDLAKLQSGQPQVDGANRLSRALQTAHSVAASVRALSHRLHPSMLRLAGLVDSLDGLRSDLSHPHLPIAFSHRDVPGAIDPDIALCVFRVAQEALTNAVKHSKASQIWVELTGSSSSLELTITDNGKGFDVDSVPHAGLGLISIKERVESVGGRLEIQSTASGTHLHVSVPIRSSEQALAVVPSA